MEENATQIVLQLINGNLREENWDKARERCNLLLESDPNNAQAYIAKLMADFHVDSPDKLCDIKGILESNENYRKAVFYADKETAEILQEYNRYTIAKNGSKSSATGNVRYAAEKPKRKTNTKALVIIGICVLLFIFFYIKTMNSGTVVNAQTFFSTVSDTLKSINPKRIWSLADNDMGPAPSYASDTLILEGNSYYHLKDNKYLFHVTVKNCYSIKYNEELTFEFFDKEKNSLGKIIKCVSIDPGCSVDLDWELPDNVTPEEIDYFHASHMKPEGFEKN